jgi:hypothetical protein
MPTGYTAAIADDISFDEFVMNCSRAMGALVMMRDEPSGAKIPEKFEPSDYHVKKIKEINNELLQVENISIEDAENEAELLFRSAIKSKNDGILKSKKLRVKYEKMLLKVENWVPPTPDHKGMKDFMSKQIKDSIDFDCNESYYSDQVVIKISGPKWKQQKIASLNKDLAYHIKENESEIQRTKERNDWLKALRDSLK